MSHPIDKALGLNPLPAIIDNEREVLPVVQTEQAQDDIDTVRDNLYDAVAKSQEAVEDMITIARQSQHPKAYEILNSAIKTYADISMGIADLQVKRQRLMGKTQPEQQTINNNLFVGSTADLQKMLNDLREGDGNK